MNCMHLLILGCDVLTRLTYVFQINKYGCFMYKKSKERVNCDYMSGAY
jgi:hypothetical protein